MKAKYFMFKRTRPIPSKTKGKVWDIEEYTDGPISIMSEVKGYAMVRKRGCNPFVIKSIDIIREESK